MEELDFDVNVDLANEPVSEEQQSFNELAVDAKLARLDVLIQKTQLYSQIILDNMMEKSLQKRQEQEQNGDAQGEDAQVYVKRQPLLYASGSAPEAASEAASESASEAASESESASETDSESDSAVSGSDSQSPGSDSESPESVADLSESPEPPVSRKSRALPATNRTSNEDSDEEYFSLVSHTDGVEVIELGLETEKEITPQPSSGRRDSRHASRLSRLDTIHKLRTQHPVKRTKQSREHKKRRKVQKSSRSKKARDALLAAQANNHLIQPALITGCTMKDYQLDGLEWLITLYENGLNGILADEMGLGKTLQTILILSHLMEHGIKGPFLVVAPLSTVSNWCNEFRKFTPKIKVMEYTGGKESRSRYMFGKVSFKAHKWNVVVTSYQLVVKDFRKFGRIDWKYLVVDEGHRLKNFNSILIRYLKRLNVDNRLLLTGTPLQNNLVELWSLLNFILPDIFPDLNLFQQWFDFDAMGDEVAGTASGQEKEVIKKQVQERLIKSLHAVLKPFMLRRMKKDVMGDLPPKKEYIIYTELTPVQRIFYSGVLDNNLKWTVLRLHLKEYLMCNHQKLFNSVQDLDFIDSFVSLELEPVRGSKRKRTEVYDRDVLQSLVNGSEQEFLELDASFSEPEELESDGRRVDSPKKTYTQSIDAVYPASQQDQDSINLEFEEMIAQFSNNNEAQPESEVKNEKSKTLIQSKSKGSTPRINQSSTRKRESKSSDDVIVISSDDNDGEEEAVSSRRKTPREIKQRQLITTLWTRFQRNVSQMKLLNRVMQLRNICGSHYLYYEPIADDRDDDKHLSQLLFQNASKVQLLKQLLDRLLKENHKVLIFSQFTKMLELIGVFLSQNDISYSLLTGEVSQEERDEEISRFSSHKQDANNVFLLSTRAGGLGINLVEADTIILFDNDWNPQMDIQAMGRAHRIGQTKPVKVFRFVVKNTVEEILIFRSFDKRALEQKVIKSNSFSQNSMARKLVEKNIDLGKLNKMSALWSVGESLNLGRDTSHILENKILTQDPVFTPLLTDEEMNELMDRSPECFARETVEFPHIFTFEVTSTADES